MNLDRLVRCGDCKWRDADGLCVCPKIHEAENYIGGADPADDELVYSYYEGGSFWVGPNFGCVHGEA